MPSKQRSSDSGLSSIFSIGKGSKSSDSGSSAGSSISGDDGSDHEEVSALQEVLNSAAKKYPVKPKPPSESGSDASTTSSLTSSAASVSTHDKEPPKPKTSRPTTPEKQSQSTPDIGEEDDTPSLPTSHSELHQLPTKRAANNRRPSKTATDASSLLSFTNSDVDNMPDNSNNKERSSSRGSRGSRGSSARRTISRPGSAHSLRSTHSTTDLVQHSTQLQQPKAQQQEQQPKADQTQPLQQLPTTTTTTPQHLQQPPTTQQQAAQLTPNSQHSHILNNTTSVASTNDSSLSALRHLEQATAGKALSSLLGTRTNPHYSMCGHRIYTAHDTDAEPYDLVEVTNSTLAQQAEETTVTVVNKGVGSLMFRDLRHITILNVAHNALTKLDNLPPCLKVLDVSCNQLESVDGLWSCPDLLLCNLRRNKLTGVRGLGRSLWVQELYIGHNCLDEVAYLEHMKYLTILDISYNNIRLVSKLRTLSMNCSLKTLIAVGNDVTAIPGYRATLMNFLPSLEMLDGNVAPMTSIALKELSQHNISLNLSGDLVHLLQQQGLGSAAAGGGGGGPSLVHRQPGRYAAAGLANMKRKQIEEHQREEEKRARLQALVNGSLNNSTLSPQAAFAKSKAYGDTLRKNKQVVMNACWDDEQQHQQYQQHQMQLNSSVVGDASSSVQSIPALIRNAYPEYNQQPFLDVLKCRPDRNFSTMYYIEENDASHQYFKPSNYNHNSTMNGSGYFPPSSPPQPQTAQRTRSPTLSPAGMARTRRTQSHIALSSSSRANPSHPAAAGVGGMQHNIGSPLPTAPRGRSRSVTTTPNGRMGGSRSGYSSTATPRTPSPRRMMQGSSPLRRMSPHPKKSPPTGVNHLERNKRSLSAYATKKQAQRQRAKELAKIHPAHRLHEKRRSPQKSGDAEKEVLAEVTNVARTASSPLHKQHPTSTMDIPTTTTTGDTQQPLFLATGAAENLYTTTNDHSNPKQQQSTATGPTGGQEAMIKELFLRQLELQKQTKEQEEDKDRQAVPKRRSRSTSPSTAKSNNQSPTSTSTSSSRTDKSTSSKKSKNQAPSSVPPPPNTPATGDTRMQPPTSQHQTLVSNGNVAVVSVTGDQSEDVTVAVSNENDKAAKSNKGSSSWHSHHPQAQDTIAASVQNVGSHTVIPSSPQHKQQNPHTVLSASTASRERQRRESTPAASQQSRSKSGPKSGSSRPTFGAVNSHLVSRGAQKQQHAPRLLHQRKMSHTAQKDTTKGKKREEARVGGPHTLTDAKQQPGIHTNFVTEDQLPVPSNLSDGSSSGNSPPRHLLLNPNNSHLGQQSAATQHQAAGTPKARDPSATVEDINLTPVKPSTPQPPPPLENSLTTTLHLLHHAIETDDGSGLASEGGIVVGSDPTAWTSTGGFMSLEQHIKKMQEQQQDTNDPILQQTLDRAKTLAETLYSEHKPPNSYGSPPITTATTLQQHNNTMQPPIQEHHHLPPDHISQQQQQPQLATNEQATWHNPPTAVFQQQKTSPFNAHSWSTQQPHAGSNDPVHLFQPPQQQPHTMLAPTVNSAADPNSPESLLQHSIRNFLSQAKTSGVNIPHNLLHQLEASLQQSQTHQPQQPQQPQQHQHQLQPQQSHPHQHLQQLQPHQQVHHHQQQPIGPDPTPIERQTHPPVVGNPHASPPHTHLQTLGQANAHNHNRPKSPPRRNPPQQPQPPQQPNIHSQQHSPTAQAEITNVPLTTTDTSSLLSVIPTVMVDPHTSVTSASDSTNNTSINSGNIMNSNTLNNLLLLHANATVAADNNLNINYTTTGGSGPVTSHANSNNAYDLPSNQQQRHAMVPSSPPKAPQRSSPVPPHTRLVGGVLQQQHQQHPHNHTLLDVHPSPPPSSPPPAAPPVLTTQNILHQMQQHMNIPQHDQNTTTIPAGSPPPHDTTNVTSNNFSISTLSTSSSGGGSPTATTMTAATSTSNILTPHSLAAMGGGGVVGSPMSPALVTSPTTNTTTTTSTTVPQHNATNNGKGDGAPINSDQQQATQQWMQELGNELMTSHIAFEKLCEMLQSPDYEEAAIEKFTTIMVECGFHKDPLLPQDIKAAYGLGDHASGTNTPFNESDVLNWDKTSVEGKLALLHQQLLATKSCLRTVLNLRKQHDTTTLRIYMDRAQRTSHFNKLVLNKVDPQKLNNSVSTNNIGE